MRIPGKLFMSNGYEQQTTMQLSIFCDNAWGMMISSHRFPIKKIRDRYHHRGIMDKNDNFMGRSS